RVVVENNDTGDDGLLRQLAFGQQELETQRELVTSRPVAEIAEGNLTGSLTVEQLTPSRATS
ncbi:MAG: hypothetical protein R3320_04965, partial [Nitriliruptorales bacterium]|nr:hypothetical protein [Nitriliruptorales bacterium]